VGNGLRRLTTTRSVVPSPGADTNTAIQKIIWEDKNMISEKNRTRNLTITLRVTPSERELFLRGAEKRNMTLTDFLVSAALYKPSHAIKECKAILKKLNEVQAELLRAESDHPDYADVLATQKELYQLLFLLARKETI
jgi:uncharacterized protein (DUF1778 family)